MIYFSRRIAPDFSIDVTSNEPIPYLVYALVVNEKVHTHKYLELEGNETLEYIVISPTKDMLPHAFLYVYYVVNETLVWNEMIISFKAENRNVSI